MEVGLVRAGLFRRDLNFDEKPLNRLPSRISAGRADVEPLRAVLQVTMRFRNPGKAIRFQNRADSGGIQSVHFVDANMESDWEVLFLGEKRKETVFCAACSLIFEENHEMVRAL